MLSVPSRWISSTAKRNLPSRKARKSVSSGHDIPLIDTHVDPVPTIHGNTNPDHNNDPAPTDEKGNCELHGEGKGRIVDCSV